MRRPAPSSIARPARNIVLAGVALLLASAACGHDWSTADTAGGDADAVADGPVDTVACDPAGALRCEGDELQQCTTDGWALLESCRFACLADELRCAVFDPLNIGPEELLGTAADLLVPADVRLDYDTNHCEFLLGAEARLVGEGADGISCQVTAGNLQVDGELFVRGAYPLILVARGSAVLAGTVDLSAVGVEPGAGGGQGGALDGAAGLGFGAGGGGRHYSSYHDGGGGGGPGLIVVRTADGSFDVPGIVSPSGPGLLLVQPLAPEP
jgi:hypothetical protein